jgi:hypothetical protein
VGAGGSPTRVTPGRVASGPGKAGTCQHCQNDAGPAIGMERSTQGTGVYVPQSSDRLEPGGYGPAAVRTRRWWRGTPGLVFNDWLGGHGEVLRGNRGDAAGTESGSSFIVNTGTVPVLPPPRIRRGWSGLGASTADRSGAGRSRRSTPSRGEPRTWERAAAISRREGSCNAARRVAEWQRTGHGFGRGSGSGYAGQASPLGGGRSRPPVDDLFNFVHDPATLLMAFDRIAGNLGAPTRPACTA